MSKTTKLKVIPQKGKQFSKDIVIPSGVTKMSDLKSHFQEQGIDISQYQVMVGKEQKEINNYEEEFVTTDELLITLSLKTTSLGWI